jgi:signal transduction histidine kinase
MKTVVSRLLAFLSSNNPSPGLKQLAITVAFMISLLILLLVPGIPVTSEAVTSVGIGLLVLATLLSAAFTYTNPRFARWVILIPVIDFLAIGAYRAGTGGSESLFSAIITFPVVWIAAEKGRGYIVLAAIGSAIALLAPNILGLSPLNTTGTIVRVIFSPLVYLFVAAIVNELSRQSRAQLTAISDLAEEKERMLARTFEYAGQLEESEAKFRDADRMFRGVWAAVTEQSVIGTDVTGLIDAWNPGAEKLLGLNWRDAEGKRFIFDFHLSEELEDRARELNYPPGETVLNPGFSALVENARLGEAESREWTYVRDDGTTVPVALSVTQRMDEAGRTIGYLFVASDVTQAREVSRLKDEFVGLISHELRTPLSSILGYLELMRDDDEHPLSDEQEQYLAVAERNAHRLLRLVGDLLFTAQVESGKFPLDLREVDLENIVKAAVESARPAAVTAGITVVDEIFDDGALVYGDPVRLGQICDNLISNAVKFTPRGGTVTVSLSRTEKNAVITVRDTGMGIAESELDQLFSRFFRATTATKNAVPGVGLGLTITKALVTAQHGTMDVTSEEGVGTEFSVSLPLSVAASVDEPQLSA